MVTLVSAKPRPITRELYRAQRGICAGCGRKMPPLGDPCLVHHVPSIDHVWPCSRGGSDSIGNMILMHAVCNSLKGNRDPTGCELIWHEVVRAHVHNMPVSGFTWPPSSRTPGAIAQAFRAAFKSKS